MPDDPQPDLPDHVTLPLLSLVTQQSLDQDYAQAAARREPQGGPRRHGKGSWVAVIGVLAVFGLLVSTAAAQETRNAAVDETSRSALIGQIDARREALARTQDKIGRVRAANALLEQRVEHTSEEAGAADAELLRLQTRSGFGPARGPGVRVVVDSAPDGLESEAVRDSDLALLVDALWGVGAEAIAVNGQRLTVLSAFRNVGAAIHVNGVPLSPPYVLEAIGDPRALQSDLVDSQRGRPSSRSPTPTASSST